MKSWLLVGATLAVLLTTTSCLKDPNLKNDNGPEVPPETVQMALLNAWGDVSPISIQENEFIYMEQSQKISTLEPRLYYKEATQITSRKVNTETNTIDYRMVVQSSSFDPESGQFQKPTSEQGGFSVPNVGLTEPDPSSAQTAAFPESLEQLSASMKTGSVGLYSSDGEITQRFLGVLTVQNLLLACVKAPGWDVTCHNLRTSQGKMSPPPYMASRPNCSDIPNCQLPYKKVAFDLVVNFTDEENATTRQEKAVYEMTFSEDVPFLARLMEFCYKGLVAAGNQKVVVKICNKIENFERGQ